MELKSGNRYRVCGVFKSATAIYVRLRNRYRPQTHSARVLSRWELNAVPWYRIKVRNEAVEAFKLLCPKDPEELESGEIELTGEAVRELEESLIGDTPELSFDDFGIGIEPVDESERETWHSRILEEKQKRSSCEKPWVRQPKWEQPSKRHALRFLRTVGLPTLPPTRLGQVVEQLLDMAPDWAVKRLSRSTIDVLFRRDWLESIQGQISMA